MLQILYGSSLQFEQAIHYCSNTPYRLVQQTKNDALKIFSKQIAKKQKLNNTKDISTLLHVYVACMAMRNL